MVLLWVVYFNVNLVMSASLLIHPEPYSGYSARTLRLFSWLKPFAMGLISLVSVDSALLLLVVVVMVIIIGQQLDTVLLIMLIMLLF